MNLHAIVNPIVAAINPNFVGTIQVSTGYVTDADFVQQPQYTVVSGVAMQVQALTAKELAQISSMNIEGLTRGVYLYGDIEGIVRKNMKGGDVLTFNGNAWKVVQVLETWDADNWCKVAVSQQLD
jgi:hypothetical protein